MEICVTAEELRAALVDIERAEQRGFHHCLAVFRLAAAGPMLGQNLLEYSDMLEKAHPTDAGLNWGRFQHVSRDNWFIEGKLVPIKEGVE